MIMIIKERPCRIADFAVLGDHGVKLKENKKRDKYLDLARELKKSVEHESDDYTNCNWCSWYSQQRIGTRTGGLGNNGTGGDHPKYSIVEIGQEYWEESWRLEATCSNSSERPLANTDVKNSQGSECSKLAQKEYKASHDWVGKVIHWEMCKKFKFNHANKWYMHNPASVL